MPGVARAPTHVPGEELLLDDVECQSLSPRGGDGHQDPRGAVPALQPVFGDERLLQRGEHAVVGETLDRLDRCAIRLHGEEQAAADRLAVDDHGARPTDPVLASEVGARERTVVTEEVGKRGPRLDGDVDGLAVDVHPDVHRGAFGHAASSSRRALIRRTRRPATIRRYSAEAWMSPLGVIDSLTTADTSPRSSPTRAPDQSGLSGRAAHRVRSTSGEHDDCLVDESVAAGQADTRPDHGEVAMASGDLVELPAHRGADGERDGGDQLALADRRHHRTLEEFGGGDVAFAGSTT